MKVLCIGHSSYDITIPVEDYPRENFKYRCDEIVECGGGPAANAAYLLGKWGCEVFYAGVVGNDTYGQKIRKELMAAHVDLRNFETNYDHDTSVSFILANKKTGTRTLFNCASARPEITKYYFDMHIDIILTDGNDYRATIAAFNKYPDAVKVVDAGRPTKEVIDLCDKATYIVCSKEYAEKISQVKYNQNSKKDILLMYHKLKDHYNNREVIITLEDNGVLYTMDGNIKLLPGLRVVPTDTTGAGDIFHGVFVYGLTQKWEIEKCIKIANIAAGVSVTKIGARKSIPELAEVLEIYEAKN